MGNPHIDSVVRNDVGIFHVLMYHALSTTVNSVNFS